VAQELDVPIWKANEICWCLERVFYAPGQGRYRVTRSSLDVFKDLLDRGLTIPAALAVLWQFKQEGRLRLTSSVSEWTAFTGGRGSVGGRW
jgi:hypothetical protein